MITKLRGFTKTVVSLIMLTASILTIGLISYQVFSPQGRIFQSLSELWNEYPLALLALAALLFLAKGWISNYHPGQRLSNVLVYATVIIGILLGLQYLL